MNTIRKHLNTLEKFYKFFNSINSIDFYKKTICCNEIYKRIIRINNYLGTKHKKCKFDIKDLIKNSRNNVKE